MRARKEAGNVPWSARRAQPRRAGGRGGGWLAGSGGGTHAHEGLVSGWGSGELEAERPGRVGEPAVVRGAEVQRPGALGHEVEGVPFAGLGLGRSGIAGGELAV